MNKKSIYLSIALMGLIGIAIYYLPNIYNYFQNLDGNKIVKPKEEEIVTPDSKEEITKDSEIIASLTYPVMRNDIYSADSYYQLDGINIDNFSNNDILYNAFIDLYEGYITDHTAIGCTNESKEVEASYLSSRIKNVIGRNTKYTDESFQIPNYSLDAKYVGEWKYDINSNSYVYYGDCKYTNKNIIYYDLTNLNKVESENNELYLYYDVAFSKITKNSNGYTYIIYSDANMKNEIANGTINNIEDIKEEFNKYLGSDKVSLYKYTFKKGLCTYDNYCFYEGEWVK